MHTIVGESPGLYTVRRVDETGHESVTAPLSKDFACEVAGRAVDRGTYLHVVVEPVAASCTGCGERVDWARAAGGHTTCVFCNPLVDVSGYYGVVAAGAR